MKPKVTREEARARVDFLSRAPPFRLSTADLNGRVRYKLMLDGAHEWSWPTTANQRARTLGSNTYLVEVCAGCEAPSERAEAPDSGHIRPNAWVNSDDLAIRRFARSHAARGTMGSRMRRLSQAIQRHMTGPIDYREYASASSAFRSRSGDCTEFAMLLAASARALGIPTRVVAGLAYQSRFGSRHRFTPHVWVEAWNGRRWRSFDAALGRVRAGHIAMAVGDGSPQQYLATIPTLARLTITDAVRVEIEPAGSAPH